MGLREAESAAATVDGPLADRHVPICWPAGFRRTSPPKATAQSWWPRQMPRTGIRSSTAVRISARTCGSHDACSSASASIEHAHHHHRDVAGEVVGQRIAGVGTA